MIIPTLRRTRGQIYEPSYQINPALTSQEIQERTKSVMMKAFDLKEMEEIVANDISEIQQAPLDIWEMSGHKQWKNELIDSGNLHYINQEGHDYGLIGMLIASRASDQI